MTDNNIQEMFKKLKEHIGVYVRCKYWLNEELKKTIIKLDRVDEYDFIFDVDTYTWIHFLTSNQCIILIETLDGKLLYENKIFEKEYKNITDEDELYQREKLVFGNKYISKTEKTTKNNLINQGLIYIDEELTDDWINFVNMSKTKITKATISMLDKINKGMNYYQAETITFTIEFILSVDLCQLFRHNFSRFSYF